MGHIASTSKVLHEKYSCTFIMEEKKPCAESSHTLSTEKKRAELGGRAPCFVCKCLGAYAYGRLSNFFRVKCGLVREAARMERRQSSPGL